MTTTDASISAAAPAHRVVVVGGGFGGLPACRVLGGYKGVEVTLIDRRNHHLFQPLLYHVATGILSEGEIATPLRQVLRRYDNVTVELAEVTGFDLDQRIVLAKSPFHDPVEVPYDTLIVAAGVNQSYFGNDALALHAPGMKTLDDALELRRRIFGSFEMAEVTTDPSEKQAWLTTVVVGAGPTGVEVAGQIRELAVRSLHRNFRTFDASSVRVLLLDGGKEPLATFGDRLSDKARAMLEKAGVELRMGCRVTSIDAQGVDYETETGAQRVDARVAVWAAGVQASPLAALLGEATGATVDRGGRIETLPDLTLPEHPEVFAVGDMVSVNGLPGVAEVALQGSLHAANTIKRRLHGKDTKPYKYRDLGSIAAIGRFKAICSVGKLRLSGFVAWLVWLFVHLAFTNGFSNRISALWSWFWAMVGRNRKQRIFSVAHTGGDLGTPESVRSIIQPAPFPEINIESHSSPETA